MRPAALSLLPLTALSISLGLMACGGEEAIPSAPWHPKTGAGDVAGSSSGSGSSGASSTGGSSSGSTTSSGGTTGSSSGGGGTGSTSSSSGGSEAPTTLEVTLGTSTLQLPLMDTGTVTVSVSASNYTGQVQLAATGLPGGVTATFDDATPTVNGSSASAVLTLATATNAIIGMGGITVTASAGGVTESAPVALVVQPQITLHIPMGVNDTGATVDNPNSTAYGPYPITIVAPPGGLSSSSTITVYFKNDDSVSHEIHADDATQGFAHDPGPFGAGQMDPFVRNINTAGTYDFYLHDQGAPITPGRIFIQTSQ
jgi:hypothetical protein